MPAKSASQERLMQAAAHTKGGYGGVPQSVGKEFVGDSGKAATELDIARQMVSGDLKGPQRIGDTYLFDLRVTGTGISYRPSLNEYVYRPSELYLNDEFLERCQGVPVIFDHPAKGMLDTDEWRNRAIGSLMLPYIPKEDDEFHDTSDVWAIARIYDSDAAELMMTTHISTSPGVRFGDDSKMRTVRAQDGSKILIEDTPSTIDHLAVCEVGVWDKGREPSGVNTG